MASALFQQIFSHGSKSSSGSSFSSRSASSSVHSVTSDASSSFDMDRDDSYFESSPSESYDDNDNTSVDFEASFSTLETSNRYTMTEDDEEEDDGAEISVITLPSTLGEEANIHESYKRRNLTTTTLKTHEEGEEIEEDEENGKVEVLYRKHQWPCDPTALDYIPHPTASPQMPQSRKSLKKVRFSEGNRNNNNIPNPMDYADADAVENSHYIPQRILTVGSENKENHVEDNYTSFAISTSYEEPSLQRSRGPHPVSPEAMNVVNDTSDKYAVPTDADGSKSQRVVTPIIGPLEHDMEQTNALAIAPTTFFNPSSRGNNVDILHGDFVSDQEQKAEQPAGQNSSPYVFAWSNDENNQVAEQQLRSNRINRRLVFSTSRLEVSSRSAGSLSYSSTSLSGNSSNGGMMSIHFLRQQSIGSLSCDSTSLSNRSLTYSSTSASTRSLNYSTGSMSTTGTEQLLQGIAHLLPGPQDESRVLPCIQNSLSTKINTNEQEQNTTPLWLSDEMEEEDDTTSSLGHDVIQNVVTFCECPIAQGSSATSSNSTSGQPLNLPSETDDEPLSSNEDASTVSQSSGREENLFSSTRSLFDASDDESDYVVNNHMEILNKHKQLLSRCRRILSTDEDEDTNVDSNYKMHPAEEVEEEKKQSDTTVKSPDADQSAIQLAEDSETQLFDDTATQSSGEERRDERATLTQVHRKTCNDPREMIIINDIQRDASACQIQRFLRGSLCRHQLLREIGIAKRRRCELREKSVGRTKLHSQMRRSARAWLRERTDLHSSMILAIRRVCAIKIQRWFRCQSKRAATVRLHNSAATQVQKIWRSFFFRTNYYLLKLRITIVKIQAIYRGSLCRIRYRKTNKLAKRLQAFFRRIACRNRLQKAVKAVISIQSAARGYVYRKIVNFEKKLMLSNRKAESQRSLSPSSSSRNSQNHLRPTCVYIDNTLSKKGDEISLYSLSDSHHRSISRSSSNTSATEIFRMKNSPRPENFKGDSSSTSTDPSDVFSSTHEFSKHFAFEVEFPSIADSLDVFRKSSSSTDENDSVSPNTFPSKVIISDGRSKSFDTDNGTSSENPAAVLHIEQWVDPESFPVTWKKLRFDPPKKSRSSTLLFEQDVKASPSKLKRLPKKPRPRKPQNTGNEELLESAWDDLNSKWEKIDTPNASTSLLTGKRQRLKNWHNAESNYLNELAPSLGTGSGVVNKASSPFSRKGKKLSLHKTNSNDEDDDDYYEPPPAYQTLDENESEAESTCSATLKYEKIKIVAPPGEKKQTSSGKHHKRHVLSSRITSWKNRSRRILGSSTSSLKRSNSSKSTASSDKSCSTESKSVMSSGSITVVLEPPCDSPRSVEPDRSSLRSSDARKIETKWMLSRNEVEDVSDSDDDECSDHSHSDQKTSLLRSASSEEENSVPRFLFRSGRTEEKSVALNRDSLVGKRRLSARSVFLIQQEKDHMMEEMF